MRSEMDWASDPLWQSLAAMRIEREGAALGFAARLAREHHWPIAHAEAVFEEYRRFLYLAGKGHRVTPSEHVDQAWHLHLAYSRHYWDILCGTILKQPLHHEPTSGGPAQDLLYRDLYTATLARYRALFRVEPPPAVWPDTGARFASRPRRIDASRYWLVPRALPGQATVAVGASALLAACSALAANAGGAGSDWSTIVFVLFGAALVVGATMAVIRRGASRSDREGAWNCTTSCGGKVDNGDSSDSGDSSGCGGGCGGGD